jgi:hypothetical protein
MNNPPPDRARSKVRQERLARALRENLKRRKEQARLRRAPKQKDDACNRPSQVPISPRGQPTNGGETG